MGFEYSIRVKEFAECKIDGNGDVCRARKSVLLDSCVAIAAASVVKRELRVFQMRVEPIGLDFVIAIEMRRDVARIFPLPYFARRRAENKSPAFAGLL